MKKAILLTVCSVLMVIGLTGCKAEKAQSFTFKPSDVSDIEIETGGASVSIVKGSDSNIEVTYTQDVATLQDGVLKINIPMPKAGVNVKKQADVTIYVPDKVFEEIKIKSEVGNVKVENVNTEQLTVDTQYGNITLSGMEGQIAAKAEMGSINTDLPIGSEIKSLGTAGQKLEGQMGASEHAINLYTNTGVIELR